MKDQKIKLPKQWLHWAQKAGLTPTTHREWYGKFYLKGLNRYWRVTVWGTFECSCPPEHFDRWANSVGAEVDYIPQTEEDFLLVVNLLKEESKGAK